MDGEESEEETYIQHLRSMFNDLDERKTGGLTRHQMKALSEKLSLQQNQSELLLQLSFGSPEDSVVSVENEEIEQVDFGKFQECFVAVLSATTELTTSDSEEEQVENHEDEADDRKSIEEVKPRVVREGRSYGRRSHSDLGHFEEIDCLETSAKTKAENLKANKLDDPEDNDVFDNGFYELPDRTDKVYFEASGQLQHQSVSRLWQKSGPNLNDSQNNLSISSPIHQHQHLFPELDKDDNGYIDCRELFRVWKDEGVSNPQGVLQVKEICIS